MRLYGNETGAQRNASNCLILEHPAYQNKLLFDLGWCQIKLEDGERRENALSRRSGSTLQYRYVNRKPIRC